MVESINVFICIVNYNKKVDPPTLTDKNCFPVKISYSNRKACYSVFNLYIMIVQRRDFTQNVLAIQLIITYSCLCREEKG